MVLLFILTNGGGLINFKMYKVLLTGSNGFLGKLIFKELCNYVEIFTLSRSNSDINIDLSTSKPNLEYFDIIIHALGKAHDFNTNKFSYFEYVCIQIKVY